LPASGIAAFIRRCDCGSTAAGLIEVFALGRVPLAISARCYHARLHRLHKDNCRFVCENNPDRLAVKTLADQDFLAVYGVQTLSYPWLIGDIGALRDSGVGSLRRLGAGLRHGRGHQDLSRRARGLRGRRGR